MFWWEMSLKNMMAMSRQKLKEYCGAKIIVMYAVLMIDRI